MKKLNLKALLKLYGKLYSEELGIKLDSKKPSELFKWLVASMLFGARISENAAIRTYFVLKKHKALTPQAILKYNVGGLIPMMGEGGYTRYDGKTSNELVQVSTQLLQNYGGDLNKLHQKAKNANELDKLLGELYSVGPVTRMIFLREVYGIWPKAKPKLGRFESLAVRYFKLPKDLQSWWEGHKIKGYGYRNFLVMLLRVGKNFVHKHRKLES
jgi:hypothetical protein